MLTKRRWHLTPPSISNAWSKSSPKGSSLSTTIRSTSRIGSQPKAATVPHLDKYELLYEFDIVDMDDALEKIADAIMGDVWCQRSPYAETPSQALQWGWQRFTRHVTEKHQGLPTTEGEDDVLNAGAIAMDHIPDAVADAITDSNNIVASKRVPIGGGLACTHQRDLHNRI